MAASGNPEKIWQCYGYCLHERLFRTTGRNRPDQSLVPGRHSRARRCRPGPVAAFMVQPAQRRLFCRRGSKNAGCHRNTLVCGAEQITGNDLAETAAWSLQAETEQQIKTLLQKGLSYGAAWETAAIQNHKDARWFKGANNLLALAYQKAVIQNNLSVELLTLPRRGSNYNDTELTPPYASASAIRTALRNSCASGSLASVMPEDSLALLKLNETNYTARFIRQEETLTLLLGSLLARCNSHDLYEHSSGSRDLCDRFHNARSDLQQGYSSFCRSITNKRDPLPSVRRLALQLLLHKDRSFWTETPEPAYLRVLAFNNRGRNLLRKMKETAKLPVVIKPGRIERYKNTALYPLLQLDTDAADLYQHQNDRLPEQ